MANETAIDNFTNASNSATSTGTRGLDAFLNMGEFAPAPISRELPTLPQEETTAPTRAPLSSYDEAFQRAESQYGLPNGLLSTMAYQESRFNPDAVNQKSGATGILQFIPRTAKEYGINPRDPNASINAAGKKMAGLVKYYNGDITKAVAAYNYGEGNLNKAIRKAGDNWMSAIPEETQGYLSNILGGRLSQAQAPQENTYDIPLSNGGTLHVPVSMSKEQAIAEARAQGIDAVGIRNVPLLNGGILHVPDTMSDEEAVAEASKADPDTDFTTQAHAEKMGFMPSAKSAAISAGSTLLRGGSEMAQGAGQAMGFPSLEQLGTSGIEKSKEWEQKAGEIAEAPTEADAWYKQVPYYAGQVAGGIGPYAAGLALAPEAVAPSLLAGTMGSQALGSMAQRTDEQGKDFEVIPHLPAAAAETAVNYVTLGVLGPLKGKIQSRFMEELLTPNVQKYIADVVETKGVEAGKAAVGSKVADIAKEFGLNTAGMAFGDVGSAVIERAATGQDLASPEAMDEYWENLKTDLVGGGLLAGPMGLSRHAGKQGALEQAQAEAEAPPPIAPEVSQPEVNEQGYTQDIQTKLNEAKLAEEARAAQAAKDAQTTVTTEQGATTTEQGATTTEQGATTVDQGATTATTAQETQGVQEEQGATTEEVIAEPTLRKPEEVKLTDIPYHTLQWTPDDINNPHGPGSVKRSEGVAKIVDIAGRKTVTADVNGVKVPFYLSTGAGGKKDVPSGKWYPMFGIGEDGWFNKKSGKNITSYYGSPELKKVAELLDATYGDIRLDKTIPQTSATGSHIAAINEGLAPTSNGHANTRIELDANIKNTLARIAGKAPEVTEAPHWADALGLTPSSAKYKQLKQLDINDTDHHSAIKNILDSATRLNMKIDPTAVESLYKQLDTMPTEEANKQRVDFAETLGYGYAQKTNRSGRVTTDLFGQATKNEPLSTAVSSGNMGQTIEVLSQSKNPIIRHIAEVSKNLTDLTIKSGGMGKNTRAAGFYDPSTHSITMHKNHAGNEATVGHELLHANVQHAIENPTQKQKPSVEGLKKLHETVKIHPTLAKEYGLKNVHEFVSEGLTNPEFQYKLKKIKYENTTMWGKFTQSIANMLGVKRDNAFIELLTHTENLLPSEPVRRGKDTKGPKPLYNEQEQINANEVPEATTPNVSRGAQPEVLQKGKGAPISSEGIREGRPETGQVEKEKVLYSEVAPDEPELSRLRSADILVDRSPKAEELKKQRTKDIEKAQMAANSQTTLGRTLNKIRARFIAHDSMLDYATREDKTIAPNGEFHERILRNQAKERRNFISSAIEHGYVTRSSTGLLTINRSDKLNLVKILERSHDLPKGYKAEDVERILTVLANEGHQLRYQDIERRAIQRRADATKLMNFAKTFAKGSIERKTSIAAAKEIRKLAESDQHRVDKIKAEGGVAQHITPKMISDAHKVMNSVPEIKAIVDDVHKVMRSLVDLLESTGNIDATVAREWRDPKYQYAPLYMSTEELESIGESNISISSAVKGIGKVKAKGVSEHKINMFENLQKHYAFAVDAAMENNYKTASLKWLAAHGSARELASNKGSQFQQVVNVIRKGKSVLYAIDDPVLFDAFKDIARLDLPSFITAPSMVVRKGALINPMFWYRQLVRDPVMANFTAQTGLVTPIGAARSFLSILTNHNAEYKELVNKGVLQSQSNLADQKIEFIKGKKQRGAVKKGWSWLQHIHEAADAATRVEVYKAALEEAKKQKGLTKEQQNDFAVSRARDFMSFANQGSDASVRMINQSVPFFNSFLNGMDVILRNATGMNMSKADAARARKLFRTRAMYMTLASMAYAYTLSSNSEEYREAKASDWMSNWLIPGLGDGRMGKVTSPFEIGVAFKLIPEAMVRQMMGLDTGERTKELLFNSVLNGLTPPLPIPAFIKPILEAATGKAMFDKNPAEWFDIESRGSKDLVRTERGRGKSYLSDAFSDITGMSPAVSKQLLSGYGTEVFAVADMLANGLSKGFGEQVDKDWTETVPYAKAFVTNPNSLADQNEVYDQAEKFKQFANTMTHMLKVGDPRAALYSTSENMPFLYGAKAETKIIAAMTKLTQAMAYTINDPSLTTAQKKKQYDELLDMKRNILSIGADISKEANKKAP